MIKAAIDRLLTLAAPTFREVEKRLYANQQLHPIKPPMPEALGVHTLTGIVDYIAAQEENLNLKDFDDLPGLFLQVVSHKEVRLISSLEGPFFQRATLLWAEPPENRAYPFASWLDPENFIIELQTKFVPDDNTHALLAFVSSIKEASDRTSAGDGVSQTVTAKTGVTLVIEAKVPNPVVLRPYRTFLEVEQPAISCVFRLRQGPMLSLHEADGSLWRIQAIQSIKTYLVKAMTELGQNIPVIG